MQVAGRWMGRRMLIVATIALLGLDVAAALRRSSAPAPGVARPQTSTQATTRIPIDPWATPSVEPPTRQPAARRAPQLDSSPLELSDRYPRPLVLYNDPAIADNVESLTDGAKRQLATFFGISARPH